MPKLFLRRTFAPLGIAILGVVLLCSTVPFLSSVPWAGGHPPFALSSSGFSSQGFIPPRYTCAGQNVSPGLSWSGAPSGTAAFALIVIDPDAPSHTWVHWVAYNLPSARRNLPENVAKSKQVQAGGVQGLNDFNDVGYGGPCPPPGKPHRYVFTLYALNERLPLPPGATRSQVERAMKGHVLARATLIGLYGR